MLAATWTRNSTCWLTFGFDWTVPIGNGRGISFGMFCDTWFRLESHSIQQATSSAYFVTLKLFNFYAFLSLIIKFLLQYGNPDKGDLFMSAVFCERGKVERILGILFALLLQPDGFPTLLFFPAGNKSFDPVSEILFLSDTKIFGCWFSFSSISISYSDYFSNVALFCVLVLQITVEK